MFDFVNTGRPMLFFTWDLADYRDNLRGFYFDFEKEAPGPLLTESSAIIEALQRLDEVQEEYADRYRAFREKYTGLEDGRASERFIGRFL
jgi:CDP-glycerol glycerophosphotransferase